jgi:hypothetical protein
MRGPQFNDAFTLTPADATVYQPPLSGLFVGGTGAVSVVTPSGNTVVFSAVPAGAILPVAVSKVLAATVATLILGLKS